MTEIKIKFKHPSYHKYLFGKVRDDRQTFRNFIYSNIYKESSKTAILCLSALSEAQHDGVLMACG